MHHKRSWEKTKPGGWTILKLFKYATPILFVFHVEDHKPKHICQRTKLPHILERLYFCCVSHKNPHNILLKLSQNTFLELANMSAATLANVLFSYGLQIGFFFSGILLFIL